MTDHEVVITARKSDMYNIQRVADITPLSYLIRGPRRRENISKLWNRGFITINELAELLLEMYSDYELYVNNYGLDQEVIGIIKDNQELHTEEFYKLLSLPQYRKVLSDELLAKMGIDLNKKLYNFKNNIIIEA